MRLFVLASLLFLGFACGQPPALSSSRQGLATARAIEGTVQTIGDLGGGDFEWTIRVNFVGLGGTCGVYEQADVAVVTGSLSLPTAAARCAAYKDAVPTCAANTLLNCDILTYALVVPL